MEQTIRFLHTADLHLGAPTRGFCNLSDSWAEKLLDAIGDAFDRVIETALENAVDFVVIAGDVFDTAHASYGDHLRFFEGIEKLDAAGIPTYLVAGNHDPYSTWRAHQAKLPASARMMGGELPEYALFEREGQPLCLIGARGYRNQSWPIDAPISEGISRAAAVQALHASRPSAAEAPFSVGILHTGLDIDHNKAYTDPAVLLNSDVDYWACGHLHARHVLPSETAPRVAFPGCIQGRDLHESGEHGCFLVTMTRGKSGPARTQLEFIPTASVVFHSMSIDVSACQTLADITRLATAELFRTNAEVNCDEMVVHITMTGTTPLHEFLAQPDVVRDLRKRLNNMYPTFFCDMLVDHTQPLRDHAEAAHDRLFSDQVLRVADRQRSRKDEMVNFVQSEFVKRGIDVPASLTRQISDLETAAETLVLDLLEEDAS